MSDSSNKKSRAFAPGTLEQTRKNIGAIDPIEALEMQKKLGGEILPERPTPINPDTLPKRNRVVVGGHIKASGLSSSDISSKSAALSSTTGQKKASPSVNNLVKSGKARKTDEDLPAITSHNLKLMNRLMQSEEYNLKPDFGFFNFIFGLSSKNRERVTREFGEYTIKQHVEHMQAFISTLKSFIQIAPATYKAKIAAETDLKFKFLRTVGKWTMRNIKMLALTLEDQAADLTVPMLIPFVKAVYHELITIYYIGEQQVPALIKEVYADISAYPAIDSSKVQTLAKQGITEWIYVYNQIIKGMYPLLMRMCSSEYVEFPRFFTAQIVQILDFLGLSKFDLLLPEKKKKVNEEAQREKEEEERRKQEEAAKPVAGKKDEIVEAGLKILEQLFPDAGFSNLDSHPDMFPYFQPLYKFNDGFNMLNPHNGLQVAIVLIKIIDDLFHGCRNINFNLKADEKLGYMDDSITDVMGDWGFYIDDTFEKNYAEYLRNFMNTLYTQSDYASTNYGKELINTMFWGQKLYFLPHLKFNAPTLSKPRSDNKFTPIYNRTEYIRKVFTVLARRIDENAQAKKPVLGIINTWERYNFEIPNIISKRLDVLLGAKRPDDTTAATNANLIKYTLCIVAVLDWWLNNPESPAYTADSKDFYRTSGNNGAPEFSVPERTDQNQLFADGVKKAIAERQQ